MWPRHSAIWASSSLSLSTLMSCLQRARLSGGVPDALECVDDRVPLAALLGELGAALLGDAVILAAAAAGRTVPCGLNVPQSLKPVQQRIEQPVGPLQGAPGQLVDLLENRVSV